MQLSENLGQRILSTGTAQCILQYQRKASLYTTCMISVVIIVIATAACRAGFFLPARFATCIKRNPAVSPPTEILHQCNTVPVCPALDWVETIINCQWLTAQLAVIARFGACCLRK
jgi:hypothetical protein